jgi:hypothetical protein
MLSNARTRTNFLLLLAACMVLVAGCGGSSKGTVASGGDTRTASNRSVTDPASSATSPNATFIAEADRTCGRVNAEIIAIKAKSGSRAEVKRVVPRTISISRSGIAALQRLKPPAPLVHDWQRMIGYRRTLVRELGELLSAAQRNDGTFVAPLAASKKRTHEGLSTLAKANGFKDCAKVGRVG